MTEKTYRVEIHHEGRKPIVIGYYCASIEFIRKCMEGNMKYKPCTINIYAKTGKRVLESFNG